MQGAGGDLYARLHAASTIIGDRLNRDDKIISVASIDSLQNTASTSSDYTIASLPEWQPFSLTRTIPLPEALLDQCVQDAHCLMGLFSEIERAYLTMNNRLILWDYLEGNSFMTYEGLQDIIMNLAIAPPKPGYFVDDIKHVLVLVTSLSVKLLGIAITPNQGLGFYLTDLEATTNGIEMITIASSTSGRIFMSGRADGNLYELDYRLSSGWFRSSTSCTLKNHTGSSWSGSITPWAKQDSTNDIIKISVDSSRNKLYTLRRTGAIELYSLGADGHAAPYLQAKLSDCYSSAALLLPNNPTLGEHRSFSILNIQALSMQESKRFGLVAVTSTGIRLYFVSQQEAYYSSGPTLRLVHVRLPPSNAAQPTSNQDPNKAVVPFYNQPQQQPQNYGIMNQTSNSLVKSSNMPTGRATLAFSGAGGITMISYPNNATESDNLVLSIPDVGRLSQSALSNQSLEFKEVAGMLPLEGEVMSIVEVGSPQSAKQASTNELVGQVVSASRAFLIITKRSLNIVVRNRPIDVLASLLERAQENTQELMRFFEEYGRDQTCAMCLAIIVGDTVQSRIAAKAVSKALPLYTSREVSQEVMNWAKAAFYESAGKPYDPSRGLVTHGISAPGPSAALSADGKLVYSGRHEALALYMERLLRSVWKQRVTFKRPLPQMVDRQESTFSADFLAAIQKDLTSLQTVVTRDLELFIASADQWSGATDLEAIQAEHASLAALQALLKQCIEAFAFLVLLIDHQLPDVLNSCPKDMQDMLLSLSFQDLLTSQKGREVARKIVSAIINKQISRGESIDAVSNTLQEKCGSFCSPDDVYLHKAADNMRRARDAPNERGSCLREALKLYTQAAKQLTPARLKEIAGEFRSLRYAAGSVELALQCTSAWDADSAGFSWWQEGSPANDSRQGAFAQREECYKTVIEVIERCEQELNQAASASKHREAEEADEQRNSALSKALSSNDEAFHFKLYDWLMANGKTDTLLSIQSPYIERYFWLDKPALDRYDLLWQYYARNSMFAKATEVLSGLAESTEFGLDLAKRLEYLSLAANQARSQFPSSSNRVEMQELLGEAEDKLEVAQVQIEIQRAIMASTSIDEEQKERVSAQINDRLYSITELYSDFAEPYNLLQSMLLIFFVSDHRDPSRVIEIWDALIDNLDDRPGEARLDALESLITDQGRRFYPSEAVFPLLDLVSRLEKANMEYGSSSRPGWVIKVMRNAGVSFDALFEAFDELFRSRIPPFHTNTASAFLASEGIALLETWFEQSLSHRISPVTSEIPFAAAEVLAAGDRYVASLPPSVPAKTQWSKLSKKIRSTF